MDHFTYTAEFTHPFCPFCGSKVPCDTNEPTMPWIGTCLDGHTALYELDVEDDTPSSLKEEAPKNT